MTTYKFIGVPVFNPFSQQWAGVLKIRRYDPYVPLLDDGDETVDCLRANNGNSGSPG